MKNGYIITYYSGGHSIAQDLLLSKLDAEEHVNVAIDVGQADSIRIDCIDDGDVMYTTELFRVDDHWMEYRSSNVTKQYSLTAL